MLAGPQRPPGSIQSASGLRLGGPSLPSDVWPGLFLCRALLLSLTSNRSLKAVSLDLSSCEVRAQGCPVRLLPGESSGCGSSITKAETRVREGPGSVLWV